ncbi:hypothetical protein [Martelella limonii]|uniref:hypothetical protein n=1 Tax=Martelella limonii TaxID=1647649 RepID=UPI001581298D|nr:hypothetical protein [Martelella limonii]
MRIAGFEFAEGARFQAGASKNAKEVGEHLEMLRQRFKGELTPEDILDDAKHDNSPLHSFFEWDDSAAAHQYRLKQARGLIRSVVAVYVSDDRPAVRQRAYVHVAEAGIPHYRETSHAMSMTKTRDMVLQQAWRELQAWRRRYADLSEFSDLIDVIDATKKKFN